MNEAAQITRIRQGHVAARHHGQTWGVLNQWPQRKPLDHPGHRQSTMLHQVHSLTCAKNNFSHKYQQYLCTSEVIGQQN